MSESKTHDLIDDVRKLYEKIHKNDPAPASGREHQTAFVMSELQQILMSLVVDGVPPNMIENSLLNHWLRFTCTGLGHDEARSEEVAGDLQSMAHQLVTCIKAIVADAGDPGPTKEMQRLGSMLQELKEVVLSNKQPQLTRKEVEQRAAQTTLALAGFIQECLDQEIDPGLLSNAMLYYWIRVSTINGGVNEVFFQKVERNWLEVVDGVRQILKGMA